MSGFSFNITGVQTGIHPDSGPPPRRDIRDVVNDEKAFSLYVQALIEMMKMPQDDVASYFQIGGIHGKPYVEWNGSGSQPVPDSWQGYCTHGTVLFPTWHRPYVAVYEQILHSHVMKVAEKYTTADKAEWQNAAAIWRLPYWDWAQESVPPTQVISDKKVKITNFSGERVDIDNPLLGYEFNPTSQGGFDMPWAQWKKTLRCPTKDAPDAESSPEKMIENLTGVNGQIRYQLTHGVFILLTTINEWLYMSNHSKKLNPKYGSSLERIHDMIHNYTGGTGVEGHMSEQKVAGFDPVFMNHHCNVDRLLALWQAIHFKQFVPESTAGEGSWTIPSESKIDATTGLTPFWKDNATNTYWTSDSARTFQPLGYTYPEFVGTKTMNPTQLAIHILKAVTVLYGLGPSSGVSGAPGPQAALAAASAPMTSSHIYDWSVRVQSKKYVLGGSYSIYIFLGEIPDDMNAWAMSPSLVGTSEIFSTMNTGECINCTRNAEMEVEGFVFLNHSLAQTNLPSLEADVVVPYLKKNIGWRVMKHGGVGVAMDEIPSLEISVVRIPLTMGAADTIPRAGGLHWYPEITAGRPGGHRTAAE